jgi:hypothetical protein
MSLVFTAMESAVEESGQEDIAKKYLWYGFSEELIETPTATYAQKDFFRHCNEDYYIIVCHRSFQPALMILARSGGDIPTTHGYLTG